MAGPALLMLPDIRMASVSDPTRHLLAFRTQFTGERITLFDLALLAKKAKLGTLDEERGMGTWSGPGYGELRT